MTNEQIMIEDVLKAIKESPELAKYMKELIEGNEITLGMLNKYREEKQNKQAQIEAWRNRPLTKCAADRDGDCNHKDCPQTRDNEPRTTGRHCPIDITDEDY